MPSVETVDIYDILFEYVRSFPFKEDIKKRICFDCLDASCVVDTKLRIYNRPTVYSTNQQGGTLCGEPSDKPKNTVIFSSTFTNSTSAEQTNNMRTEKRTTATCRIQLTKSVAKGGSISVQVSPPNTMIQVNGGFNKEKTITTEKEEVMEEELCWSLDSQVGGCFIAIPPIIVGSLAFMIRTL
ncbi:unnamed protein product [Mesocestoides corti]|uniref:Uncharacterized protein n=1 Tax=Mesocestoides corti TaxID=53468 RepID=A0A0R3UPH3_MESCO|nr:unnamed protein product [Mesocestoides corti]